MSFLIKLAFIKGEYCTFAFWHSSTGITLFMVQEDATSRGRIRTGTGITPQGILSSKSDTASADSSERSDDLNQYMAHYHKLESRKHVSQRKNGTHLVSISPVGDCQ